MLPRIASGTILTVALGVAATWSAVPAEADAVHHVYRTGADGVWLHTVPAVQKGLLAVLPEGAELEVSCFVRGEAVAGNGIWLFGTSGEITGYVTDYYIDTQWATTEDLVAQGIPSCGSESGQVTEPPIAASSIRIRLVEPAGHRERVVQGLSDELSAAASAVNVDGQTLARIIYHEGGEYFSWRQASMKAQDHLGVRSTVGIAQIKLSTARAVALEVYADQAAAELSDAALRDKLIEDWPFAIRMAAGYVRMMQDRGVTGEWPQFMAYSLSLDFAQRWTSAGHPMDAATLLQLDPHVKPAVMLRRQNEFNQAKNAIG